MFLLLESLLVIGHGVGDPTGRSIATQSDGTMVPAKSVLSKLILRLKIIIRKNKWKIIIKKR